MIILGNFTFETKNKLRNTIRKLMRKHMKYDGGIIPKDSNLHKILHELLRKYRVNRWLYMCYESFFIKPNSNNKKYPSIWFKNLNPEKHDEMIGLTKIIANFDHDTVNTNAVMRKNLRSAMRFSIRPQIEKYRNSAFNFANENFIKQTCEHCGDDGSLEVDHDNIPFSKIEFRFMEIVKLDFPYEFDWDVDIKQPMFKDEDANFRDRWNAFHKKHATYQMLCKSCNIAKSNQYDDNRELMMEDCYFTKGRGVNDTDDIYAQAYEKHMSEMVKKHRR
jgi:5-methylcytosine-specific restriction endonuclease McrA